MISKRILIIEPDQVLAAIYSKVLNFSGHNNSKVIVVATAQDAILKADEECPDLVICELQLVSHSGIEFLYEFRSYKDWQNIPLIVLSSIPPAEFQLSQQVLFNQLGVNRYLYKPNTTSKQLLSLVSELLS